MGDNYRKTVEAEVTGLQRALERSGNRKRCQDGGHHKWILTRGGAKYGSCWTCHIHESIVAEPRILKAEAAELEARIQRLNDVLRDLSKRELPARVAKHRNLKGRSL